MNPDDVKEIYLEMWDHANQALECAKRLESAGYAPANVLVQAMRTGARAAEQWVPEEKADREADRGDCLADADGDWR